MDSALDRRSGAGSSSYFAGVPLGRWYPELADSMLVTVTEKRSRDEIDVARSPPRTGRIVKCGRRGACHRRTIACN